MAKLHPDIEAMFDNANQTLLCLMGSDFTSIQKAEFYGELNADLLNLRDRYRSDLDKKESAPSAATPGADKDSSNKSTKSVEDFSKNVKSYMKIEIQNGAARVESYGYSHNFLQYIAAGIKASEQQGIDTESIVSGILLDLSRLERLSPVDKQALISGIRCLDIFREATL